MQMETLHLSQRKIKSSSCSSHLGKQIEEGLVTFDLSVTSVLHALTAEGTKIKAMIDRHIEKMIATLKEKASHEKESLTKMLSDCKQQLFNMFISLYMCVPQAVCSNQLTNIRVTC
jgi:hypothetical protein